MKTRLRRYIAQYLVQLLLKLVYVLLHLFDAGSATKTCLCVTLAWQFLIFLFIDFVDLVLKISIARKAPAKKSWESTTAELRHGREHRRAQELCSFAHVTRQIRLKARGSHRNFGVSRKHSSNSIKGFILYYSFTRLSERGLVRCTMVSKCCTRDIFHEMVTSIGRPGVINNNHEQPRQNQRVSHYSVKRQPESSWVNWSQVCITSQCCQRNAFPRRISSHATLTEACATVYRLSLRIAKMPPHVHRMYTACVQTFQIYVLVIKRICEIKQIT